MFKFLKINRSTLALLAGYAIEKYDMFLYGFFTIVIGELFCPDSIADHHIIFGLSVFASGYLTRPLGGIFFGHLGDRLGRKKALLISIALAAIPPLLLSILPTYQQIGILAPIFLVLGRLFQGFCSGGEFSGASVFLQETSSPNRIAFSVSMLRAIGFIGVAAGTVVGYFSILPFMPSWSWRIPFIVGTILTIALYYVRRKEMTESSSFQKAKATGEIKSIPMFELLKKSKMRLVCAMALTSFATVAYYMSTVYTASLLKVKFNLPNYKIMIINTGVICAWTLLIPLIGIWADKVGIRKFLKGSILLNIVLTYPLFWLLDNHFTLANFILFQVVSGVFCASFYVPFAGLIPKLFQVNERYSGVAFSITSIQAVLGGVTPLIATLLVSFTGDKKAPAFLLILSAMVALAGIMKVKQLLLDEEEIQLPEEHLILVNDLDEVIGTEEKLKAHQLGLLHRAFSVFIFRDNAGLELLLQRRHPAKYHCGNLWTNTCCSHPRPGEAVAEAAHRRLKEEMGFEAALEPRGHFQYRADFANGLIENEVDHVFVGFANPENITPNPEEVSECRWVPVDQLRYELQEKPDSFTPWFSQALDLALIESEVGV